MAVTLSLAVTHVPSSASRRAFLSDLQRGLRLDESFRSGQLRRYVVVEDLTKAGCWPTVRRAWRTLLLDGHGASHLMVVAEDMLPCPNFVPGLVRALEAVPDQAVNVYCGRSDQVRRARERGASWCVSQTAVVGGSTVLPAELAAEFLRWEAVAERDGMLEERLADDSRLMLFLMDTGREVWNTVPSLLEHAGAEDSYMGHSPVIGGRRAAEFCQTEADTIDWTLGVDSPPRVGPSMGAPSSRAWQRLQERQRVRTPDRSR